MRGFSRLRHGGGDDFRYGAGFAEGGRLGAEEIIPSGIKLFVLTHKETEMKYLIFAMLMLTCLISRAEWEVTSVASEQVIYHDKQSKKSRGNIVRMWTLADFPEARSENFGNFLSMKTLDAFDCSEKTHALVRAMFYTEKLGTGSVIHSVQVKEKDLEWLAIKPESVAEDEWEIACGK